MVVPSLLLMAVLLLLIEPIPSPSESSPIMFAVLFVWDRPR